MRVLCGHQDVRIDKLHKEPMLPSVVVPGVDEMFELVVLVTGTHILLVVDDESLCAVLVAVVDPLDLHQVSEAHQKLDALLVHPQAEQGQ